MKFETTVEKFAWLFPLLLLIPEFTSWPPDLYQLMFMSVLILVAEIVIFRFQWLRKNNPDRVKSDLKVIYWVTLALVAYSLSWRVVTGHGAPFSSAILGIALVGILATVLRRSSTKEKA